MKRRGSKLRKFILRSLLIVVFLSSVLAVLTRNKIVQTKVTQYLAQEFAKELGTKIEIGGVEVDFLRNFHLESICIYDKHSDTILYSKTLDFRIQEASISRKRMLISDLDFYKLLVKMGEYPGEDKLNYEFIEEYFTQDTTPTSGKSWDVFLSNINLIESEFCYFYGKSPLKTNIPGEFNPDYIRFSGLNAEIEGGEISDLKGFEMKIDHLEAVERSGFPVNSLTGLLSIKGGILKIKPLTLETGATKIQGNFSMDWSKPGSINHHYEEVIYSVGVNKSSIRLSDVGYFIPWLKDHSLDINARLNIKGPLMHLKSRDCRITTAMGSRLNAEVDIFNVVNTDDMINEVLLTESVFKQADIQKILAVESFTPSLEPFGDALVNAFFHIPMTSVDFKGECQTAVGTYDGHFFIDHKRIDDSLAYDAHGFLKQFNPGTFSSDFESIKSVDAEIIAKGYNFDETAVSDFDFKLSQALINNRFVNNVNAKGKLFDGHLTAKLNAEDPVFKMNSVIEFDRLFSDRPEWVLNGRINKIDLKQLGFDTVNLNFGGNYAINIEGWSLDDLTGNVSLSDFRLQRGLDEFQLRFQSIQRPNNSILEFRGDWVDGTVKGPWKLSNTPLWLQHFAHNVAPERFKETTQPLLDSVQFDLYIPQTSWIEAFILPGLYLGPVGIRGNYFAPNNICDIKIGPMSIEYGRIYMERALISLNKPTANGLLKSKFSTNYVLVENTVYDTLGLAFEITNGGYTISSVLHDKLDRYGLKMGGNGSISEKTANFDFKKTVLKIYDQTWKLDDKASVDFNEDHWHLHDFYLADDRHYLELNGNVSDNTRDTLKIEFSNISQKVLKPFFAEGTFDSLSFKVNGNLKINSVLSDFHFLGNLDVNRLKYLGFDYGALGLSVEETRTPGQLKVLANFRNGPLEKTNFKGYVQLRDGRDAELDVLGVIPMQSKLNILQPLLTEIVTFKAGNIGGNVRITGTTRRPKLVGLITVNGARLGVDYLGTEYSMSGNFKLTDQGLFTMRPIKFYDDSKKNFGLLDLALTHENFTDFALDLKLDSLKNMKVLQTTEQMNDLFYGTAYADGKAHIYGLFSEIDMDISLKTRKRTKLAIQYPQVSSNYVSGSISFVSRESKSKKSPKKQEIEDDALGKITLDMQATSEAEVQFVIDKKLGDIIKGFGDGNMRLIYDRDEKIYLFGRYNIESGEYAFSLPGINLLKKINVNKGGNITWQGDPFNAKVDLSGSFEKKISPSTLMISAGSSGSSYPATRFVSTLNMTGNLFGPNIGFDIQAPDLATTSGTAAAEVNSVIQRIRSDKDETMRQSIALLLFGNFLPPSFAAASAAPTSSFSSAGFAGNSVSTLASSVVNDLFSKYGIPTRIQVNLDDVRNASGSSNTQLFVNSEWFLSDRLRLDLNYDPTVAVLVNSVAVPINFNLEYKTRDENWRLKAFSRSNNLILQNNNNPTTNGVSGNTLGTGILYRREFDTFKRKHNDSASRK